MKENKEERSAEERELVTEMNPDDVEAGEANPGYRIIKGNVGQTEKTRDLNPDDFA